MKRPLYAVWRYARAIIPAMVIWHLLSVATNNPTILPSPLDVADALGNMVADGSLADATAISLSRLGLGYGLAVVVCVPLGLAMGLVSGFRHAVDPMVEVLRPISGIAWIPLALILFGIGNELVIFIIFYGAAFPIVLNTVAAVREVDGSLVAAARTFGAGRLAIVSQVVIPGALPTTIVGLRIGMGTAWMSLVAAELIGAGSGLGYSLSYSRQLLMSADMMAGIVAIGVLGVASNGLLVALRRVLTPWSVKEA